MEEKGIVEIQSQGKAAIVAFKATSISNEEGITLASKQIEGFVEQNHPGGIVFDFEEVKFFSSRVLGLLLGIRTKLEQYGGVVVISGINPQLHRVFKITNLDKVFKFFPDKGSAVEAMI